MKRLAILVSAIGAFGWAGQAVQAQTYNQGFQGTSPWLTLRQPGGGFNYFTQATPQFQYASQIRQLQQANAAGMEYTTGSTGLDVTGHPSGFQTHLRYFGNTGIGRAAGSTSVSGQFGSLNNPLVNPLGGQLNSNQNTTKAPPGGR